MKFRFVVVFAVLVMVGLAGGGSKPVTQTAGRTATATVSNMMSPAVLHAQSGIDFKPVVNQAVMWLPGVGAAVHGGVISEVIDEASGLVAMLCLDMVRDHHFLTPSMQANLYSVNNLTWPLQGTTYTRARVMKLGMLPDLANVPYKSSADHGRFANAISAEVFGSSSCPTGTLNTNGWPNGPWALNSGPSAPVNGLCVITVTYYIPFGGTPGNPQPMSWSKDPNFPSPVRLPAAGTTPNFGFNKPK